MLDQFPTTPPQEAARKGPIRDDAGKSARLLSIKDLKKASLDNHPAVRQTAQRLRHAVKAEKHNMSLGSQLRVTIAAWPGWKCAGRA